MRRLILSFSFSFILLLLISCQKSHIEKKIDGIWETVFFNDSELTFWFDSNYFMDGHLYFSKKGHRCTVPRDSREDLSESCLKLNSGFWSISKLDSSWTLYIETKSGKLNGYYNITFYKDTLYNPYTNRNELYYLMQMRNKEWNILCRKVGFIDEKW